MVDELITFGPLARLIADEAVRAQQEADIRLLGVRSFAVDERDALIAYLQHEAADGDVVLLKGSRGLEMERIVAALQPAP